MGIHKGAQECCARVGRRGDSAQVAINKRAESRLPCSVLVGDGEPVCDLMRLQVGFKHEILPRGLRRRRREGRKTTIGRRRAAVGRSTATISSIATSRSTSKKTRIWGQRRRRPCRLGSESSCCGSLGDGLNINYRDQLKGPRRKIAKQ